MNVIVNGISHSVSPIDTEITLLTWLRERLDLTGAKIGCNIGRCGSCTVLLNERPVLACKTKLKNAAGKSVTTIEGLESDGGGLHPLQQAFIDEGAIQCGFCTPGMVLRAHAFLKRNASPTRQDIRKAISPNLCRCTGYQQIIDAVEAAAPCYKRKKEHE